MDDFYDSWNQDRATEILSFFKLSKNEKINNLSKGNRAKVNLLLGLALDVDYLLMDEPFSGIDIFQPGANCGSVYQSSSGRPGCHYYDA